MASKANRRPSAVRDVIESGGFIGRDNPSAEDRFYHRVEETITLLSEMPGIGRDRSELATELLPGLRSFPIRGFHNWLIFYCLTTEGIDVVRIVHGARDLQAILCDEA